MTNQKKLSFAGFLAGLAQYLTVSGFTLPSNSGQWMSAATGILIWAMGYLAQGTLTPEEAVEHEKMRTEQIEKVIEKTQDIKETVKPTVIVVPTPIVPAITPTVPSNSQDSSIILPSSV